MGKIDYEGNKEDICPIYQFLIHPHPVAPTVDVPRAGDRGKAGPREEAKHEFEKDPWERVMDQLTKASEESLIAVVAIETVTARFVPGKILHRDKVLLLKHTIKDLIKAWDFAILASKSKELEFTSF
ncbi:hypothetical protein HAX54_008091 [Datura stramonium]|uniref:Uncharacterized protein n=1 Tax=Datura stramonium TaxID=4076 RepID=A0ABS8TCV7_DATST|nr:hypothetical protein [Datura stramonium]